MNPILIKGVVVLAALLLNYIIGPFAVRAAVRDYTELPQVTNRGLPQGGKLIGQFERLLILLFVLVGSVSGVGFLLTAKSVFRFGDIKDCNRKYCHILPRKFREGQCYRFYFETILHSPCFNSPS